MGGNTSKEAAVVGAVPRRLACSGFGLLLSASVAASCHEETHPPAAGTSGGGGASAGASGGTAGANPAGGAAGRGAAGSSAHAGAAGAALPDAGTGGRASIQCPIGQIDLGGQCLACDAARSAILDRLHARIIDSGWAACTTDEDCVSQQWSTPCDGQCNVAVTATAVQPFEASIQAFADQVCDPATWRPSCGAPHDVDCPVTPYCIDGACTISDALCGGRSNEQCESDDRCSIIGGYAFDPERGCFSTELEPVGCLATAISCPPDVTPALDADGNCYAFGGCLPARFDAAPERHDCRLALGTDCPD